MGLTLLATLALPWADSANAQDKKKKPLNRFPRMVQEYFVRKVRTIENNANRKRMAIKTKAEAEAYVRSVQKRIQLSFGPWPKKTPLHPRTTRTIKRDGYIIENVIFESRPDFLVTANLYIPTGRKFPLPGVVGTCGHSHDGKAAEAYQSFAQGLAKQGYVVLIYDPIGQGERIQYVDKNLKSTVGVGVREHLMAGNQQFLIGEFFGSWRAWDGIRALDYLLTRKEVDKRHIGITGNSGGGTMTTWLCGVEQRWTMGAPSCFVTTFRRNLENELPADTEQCPPRALALGLDHSDFLAAMAPKPVVVIAAEKDYFDARGSEETYARLKHLYTKLGKKDNIRLFVGPNYHGYSQPNREAMYRMFHFATGSPLKGNEPKLKMEKDETLWCTKQGQVATLLSCPITFYTHRRSLQLANQRPKAVSAKELRRRVIDVLRIGKSKALASDRTAPDYRILRGRRSRGYPVRYATTYAVETEPGIQAIVYRLSKDRWMSRPPREKNRAILYVSHQSADAELRGEALIKDLIKKEPNATLYTVDVRGIGESQPDTTNENSFHSPYGSDYFYAIHSIMLDRPYVGQRTHDVLRVIDWLRSHGHKDVHLVGRGWGALPATFAATISADVKQVTLKNALTSYSAVAESQTYNWPLSSLLPNVLKSFDLPDCYGHLRNKNLRQIEPWDQQYRVVKN